MAGSIAKRWRQLSGKNHWRGLLDPLDIDLRRYLIHYGEIAQATYDAFNTEKASRYAGSSSYGKKDFFSNVGLEKGNQEAWSKESNWIGYVAVVTDEGKHVLVRRDIVIAWRGTVETLEWIDDVEFHLVSPEKLFGVPCDAKVHDGWYSIYTSAHSRSLYNKTSARDQVLNEVMRLVEQYKNEEISITVTGHSLGQASPVTFFLFASPRVGDSGFKTKVTGLSDLRALRIRNAVDVVPNYPLIGYWEVGEEVTIDSRKSKYLRGSGKCLNWHDLEGYLHGVAGTQGSHGGFDLVISRDMALLNKSINGLKDGYLVPVSWKIEKNKGMVQQEDGSWKLMDPASQDDDSYF
ncbi:Phospholipase A1-IIgamma [Hibiscus syriacus]|uniref:Phospholipase A1 n=1 Tax=Hibiscus syriacus TaxID=106335 RepID=A0A6A3A813_HIBSY|nr:Phospholipase A1-IIgamma [Hibiscus syriacus]